MEDPERVLFTYAQVAKMCGVSDRTIWRMVDEGELPVVRFAGRTVRIHRADIEAFIKKSKSDSKGVNR